MRVKKASGNDNIDLAIGELIADFERNHKRFMPDTCFAGDSLRLI